MKDHLTRSVPEPLLKPSKVAELLNISEKTVYKHSEKLCGFKPAGLGILRFRKEIIYGIMEGQDQKTLVLQFPVSEANICGKRVQNKTTRGSGKGKTKRRVEKSTARSNRHDIFGGL